MSGINFDELFTNLKTGVESIARETLKEYESEAKADGQKTLQNMKDNLQQWAKELETGSISKDDLAYLLQEEIELDKMTALKQAGLAEVRIDEFRNNIINMVIGTLTGLVKI